VRKLTFLALIFVATACGPTTTTDAGTDVPVDTGPSRPAECEAIVAACHPVDPGSGPITECHEFAEVATRTAAECTSMSVACLALCRAAADAGADTGADVGPATDTGPTTDVPVNDSGAGTDATMSDTRAV
jgi:hypothetical protein